jgi:hypothetical protein
MLDEALNELRLTALHLEKARKIIASKEFRVTVPTGQALFSVLPFVSQPFLAIEAILEDEIGAYL